MRHLSSLQQAVTEKNIVSINQCLDSILQQIAPYKINDKGAVIAAGKAASEYAKVINQYIANIKSEAGNLLSEMKELEEKASASKISSDEYMEAISNYHTQLFKDDDEEKCISTEISSLLQSAEQKYATIKEFFDELTSGDAEDAAIIFQIREAKDKVEKTQEEIEQELNVARDKLKSLKKFYGKVYGIEDEKGNVNEGLQKYLDVKTKEIDEAQKKHEETYKTLQEEIESLLPGATSAGLSSTFLEKAKALDRPIRHDSLSFYACIVLLVIFSVPAVTQQVGKEGVEFYALTDWRDLLVNMTHKLPLVFPLIWLTYFISKRRSEKYRLREEYTHKAVVAASYHSFKTQIEALDEDDGAVLGKLMQIAVETIGFNPSVTLDKKHGDKPPAHKIIEETLRGKK